MCSKFVCLFLALTTSCEMRFLPCDTGKKGLVRQGSQICVPAALREETLPFSNKEVQKATHAWESLFRKAPDTQGTFDHDKGQKSANFGAPSPLEALHWIFCFFSSLYVQFSKTSPLKSGESSEKSSGENRVKSCHVCGCHGFFGPEICLAF